ncbi:hypothetical protein KFK09_013349 [Dendrobium nobile]|uniref:Uncharacterized protein n=1 Tax=Dendrobium nobile TaxID=94219 RepID=A0A8T3B766_DENNO|nr:hypothetical protein KFK09_013349 [Dendrobium nobile]
MPETELYHQKFMFAGGFCPSITAAFPEVPACHLEPVTEFLMIVLHSRSFLSEHTNKFAIVQQLK